eukprot:scaffold20361_cov46-Cyclotella_meneghiniana.AAC.2
MDCGGGLRSLIPKNLSCFSSRPSRRPPITAACVSAVCCHHYFIDGSSVNCRIPTTPPPIR